VHIFSDVDTFIRRRADICHIFGNLSGC